ncbi:MAG: hypothetical protein RIB46_09780 [Pseudomonadales bacterium]
MTGERSWRELMRTGGDCCRCGRDAAAVACYERALAIVQAMIDDGQLNEPLLLAKVAAHQARAAALARLCALVEAERELASAHRFIRDVVHDRSLSQSLRRAAQAHCARTFAEWQALRRRYGLAPMTWH